MQPIRLTELVTGGGCAAKLGPSELSQAVRNLDLSAGHNDPNLLIGMENLDDAGVYKVGEGTALVQTLDFITPLVDDPYTFGQIAATNALSDIYAMGGRPITAMNVVCYPRGGDMEILGEILRGGLDKIRESGASLVGGHSVCDPEIKYGVSVTGLVDPAGIWTNSGARRGDKLVFTKRLGTGIIGTAIKQQAAPQAFIDAALKSMTTLNAEAKQQAESLDIHAATDITGFSLMGHLYQLARASNVVVALNSAAIPILPGALELAEQGLTPGGTERNRAYAAPHAHLAPSISQPLTDILYDPQTSGGLLFALSSEDADTLVRIRQEKNQPVAIIGEVTATYTEGHAYISVK